MVFVQLGSLNAGSFSDNVGVFSGQNIQSSWDSHGSSTVAFGICSGDVNLATSRMAYLSYQSYVGQPTYDSDFKGNFVRQSMA